MNGVPPVAHGWLTQAVVQEELAGYGFKRPANDRFGEKYHLVGFIHLRPGFGQEVTSLRHFYFDSRRAQ
jgi:hypothetical protein